MRQSKLFGKTLRKSPKDEVSANAVFLTRGGFIDKVMAGVYTYLPLGLRVLKNIEDIIRREMVRVGGQEILMPSLHPKENWKKTGRFETVGDLFRFVSHYTKTDLVLAGTHEEIVSPLVAQSNLSYKDLPLSLFQIQNKFRDELRAKSGILRGREFVMKDLYSFHADENDLDRYYGVMKQAYTDIFDKVGIGDRTYFTYASGSSFARYSNEFQMLTDAGEDTIYICDKCRIAVNDEIAGDKAKCPECRSTSLRAEKAVEVGNIFKPKDKFSIPFGLTYTDENGSEKTILMGTYGIGLGRLMGAVVEASHDENGIIWPESIAPYLVHLIALEKDADIVYGELHKSGIQVLYDDRDGVTAGQKFAEADLIGIPNRVVVSNKTGDNVELKRRGECGIKLISAKELVESLAVST